MLKFGGSAGGGRSRTEEERVKDIRLCSTFFFATSLIVLKPLRPLTEIRRAIKSITKTIEPKNGKVIDASLGSIGMYLLQDWFTTSTSSLLVVFVVTTGGALILITKDSISRFLVPPGSITSIVESIFSV